MFLVYFILPKVCVYLFIGALIVLLVLISNLCMSKDYKQKLKQLQVKDKCGLNELQVLAQSEIQRNFPYIDFKKINSGEEVYLFSEYNNLRLYLHDISFDATVDEMSIARFEIYDFNLNNKEMVEELVRILRGFFGR